MKPIALQLYSLRTHAKEDLKGTLARVAEMGYRGIEFAGLYDHSPTEVRRMIDELDLQAAGAHVRLPDESSLDPMVEMCKTLGIPCVGTGVGADRFGSVEDIQTVAGEFQAAAVRLAEHDIGLVYHNHWWEMQAFDGKLGLDILYQAAPDLQAEIDTYWAANFGAVDVPEFVSRHAGRTPLLHIKDGPLEKDRAHVAVGAGRMDVPDVIAAADESVLQWLIVELDRCDGDMLEAVDASAQYLIDNGLGQGR
jgi:sugar phosphate isomerase/epimerase